jgi:hypothetical protein
MDVILTDGGIETRIIYEFKRPIGEFEACQLLADDRAAIFLGGCRGTDQRYIEALAGAAVDQGESAA